MKKVRWIMVMMEMESGCYGCARDGKEMVDRQEGMLPGLAGVVLELEKVLGLDEGASGLCAKERRCGAWGVLAAVCWEKIRMVIRVRVNEVV